ncbi:MAG: DUF2065 domain-containing protein [Rhodobacter sp.]|nr:DUF2065 domain-containing protein [Rhodobacter sp.]MCA3512858.1 DUF2065 domain-containing protein [Rhodobacter sp.]MCA3520830.1 DUF2065 domain-containing protein [Rhodobacter sp.]MCA3522514.1 DUF2065 domain-containing protein [Rhodobacter sp.]MCA3527072.1 DUF2065 domain-containing protein [Rhodobacter sp.]
MGFVALALGLVLVAEGLALALAPSRMEDLLAQLARMPQERRRLLGLAAVAVGVSLVWLARRLGV